MTKIHPTAIIESGAELDSDVEVGAYSVIGAHVKIGAGTRVGPHAVITGYTTIGRGNRIFQFVSLGEEPQDKKYAGEPTRLEIGDNNTIREFCTFNVGTVQDLGYTRIGNDNWVMAYVHIAHDCVVGDHAILANNSTLAGHVYIHDWVILGGMTAVHQFCRLGAHSFTAGASVVLQDLPPYVMCSGNPAEPRTINVEGLRRRGFSADGIAAIKHAYKTLYRSGLSLDEARKEIATEVPQHPELQIFSDFIAQTERGFVR